MVYTFVSLILGLSLIVIIVYILKTKNIFSSSSIGFVNSLLINIILPANIVHELMKVPVKLEQFRMALIFIVGILIILLLTYLFGTLLKYKRPVIGAFMLSTAFGATALIGLPVIKLLYPENVEMHANAIIASELGMVVPFFFLGPVIAQVFGEGNEKHKFRFLFFDAIKKYFRSTIGISLLIGIALSILNFKTDNAIVDFADKMLHVMGSGINLVPLVLIGLILEIKSFRKVTILIIAALSLQMIIEPLIINYLSSLISLAPSEKEVVLILSMTPSALLTPAIAYKYNCSPETCSAITFTCIVATSFLLPLGYYLWH